MIELNKIHKGHTLSVLKLIDDDSIDCVITSPPYYGLRSYQTEPQIWMNGKPNCDNHEWATVESGLLHENRNGLSSNSVSQKTGVNGKHRTDSNFCIHCNAWKGELGLEPTFELYLEHLWQIFDEIYRVLKKTGTCFVNLGDSYGTNSGGMGKSDRNRPKGGQPKFGKTANQSLDFQQNKNGISKSLMQIPSRFSIGMTDRGWILRNKIIWHKPSCMPSSAKDRLTVDYEEIFFFVKNQKYYFEQILEPANYDGRKDTMFKGSGKYNNEEIDPNNGINTFAKDGHERWKVVNGLKVRNGRCVWSVTSEPLAEAHFAVYPQELVLPMIKAGCPEFICNKCGKARERIYKQGNRIATSDRGKYKWKSSPLIDDDKVYSKGFERGGMMPGQAYEQEFAGYSDCKCNANFHPGVVLDPFIGSGTTGIVARKLNRNYIGIELQEKYIEIAENRISKELGFFI